MKEFEYKMPAKVRFGVGITGNLGRILREELGFQKVFIATDKGIVAAGILEKITNALDQEGFPYQVYDALIPDPTIEVVDEAADILRQSGADVVVAVGGGSPIDTAKAMCMLQTHEGSVRDYLFGGTKMCIRDSDPTSAFPAQPGRTGTAGREKDRPDRTSGGTAGTAGTVYGKRAAGSSGRPGAGIPTVPCLRARRGNLFFQNGRASGKAGRMRFSLRFPEGQRRKRCV